MMNLKYKSGDAVSVESPFSSNNWIKGRVVFSKLYGGLEWITFTPTNKADALTFDTATQVNNCTKEFCVGIDNIRGEQLV